MTQVPKIKVSLQRPNAKIPVYSTEGAAGADLYAANDDDIHIKPGFRIIIPTGLSVEIPTGWEIQIRSRSGLALKKGVVVMNAPGTIDSDYRGEIGVILVNDGEEIFTVQPGDRIAQMVYAFAPQAEFEVSTSGAQSESARGTGGFGSTGV